MADPYAPVATGIIPPDPQAGLNTLSKILSIRGQQQGLAGQAADVQQKIQDATQRQAAATYLKNIDFTSHVGPDGTLDLNSVLKDPALDATGDAKPQIIQSLLGIKGKQLDNSRALMAVNKDAVTGFGEAVNSLKGDPDVQADNDAGRAKVQFALEQFGKQGPDQGRISGLYSPVVQHAPQGKLAGALNAIGLQAQTVSAQQTQQNQQPSNVEAGADVVQQTIDPQTGRPTTVSTIHKSIPPGFELTEDPVTHNKYLWNRQTGESRAFGSGAPTSGGKAPPAAPPQRQVGEAGAQEAQVNTNFQTHQANVKAASAANQQLDQIKNVATLLDQGVKTGKGAEGMAHAEQALSNIPGLSGLAGANSQAAKFDLLNKFLERIGADYGSLNGSPAKTDAGAESLRSQIGSTGYNPEALRDVMKYTAAQYQAAKAKDNAEQNFFSQKGNGILNQDQFEKQWRNSYDPRVYQLANEPKDVAKAEIQKMAPADRATFFKKYAELKAMGAAPQ